jgi:hypothetical protein
MSSCFQEIVNYVWIYGILWSCAITDVNLLMRMGIGFVLCATNVSDAAVLVGDIII